MMDHRRGDSLRSFSELHPMMQHDFVRVAAWQIAIEREPRKTRRPVTCRQRGVSAPGEPLWLNVISRRFFPKEIVVAQSTPQSYNWRSHAFCIQFCIQILSRCTSNRLQVTKSYPTKRNGGPWSLGPRRRHLLECTVCKRRGPCWPF